jgi:hypothetical protein
VILSLALVAADSIAERLVRMQAQEVGRSHLSAHPVPEYFAAL